MLGVAATAEEEKQARLNAQMIDECVFAIAQFSTADIRQATIEYEASIKQKKRKTDRREDLYFLNKYLFDMPALLERESPETRSITTPSVVSAMTFWHAETCCEPSILIPCASPRIVLPLRFAMRHSSSSIPIVRLSRPARRNYSR